MLLVAHFDTMFINQPSHDHIYAKNFHDMDTSKYKLLNQILNVETKKKVRKLSHNYYCRHLTIS